MAASRQIRLGCQSIISVKKIVPWVYGALILVYGLPALLIRELYLHWKLTLPGIVICVAAILVLAFYYRLLLRKGWLRLMPFVLFALGDCLSGSVSTGWVQLKSSLVSVMTEAVLAAFFGRCIFVIIRSKS